MSNSQCIYISWFNGGFYCLNYESDFYKILEDLQFFQQVRSQIKLNKGYKETKFLCWNVEKQLVEYLRISKKIS